MIARMWHGVVPTALAEGYAHYLEETGVREASGTTGNHGVLVLRRVVGDHTHFLFTSFWESLAAVRRFAGDDVERAVYYPSDADFLIELEPKVAHFEVVAPLPRDFSAHFARILRPLA